MASNVKRAAIAWWTGFQALWLSAKTYTGFATELRALVRFLTVALLLVWPAFVGLALILARGEPNTAENAILYILVPAVMYWAFVVFPYLEGKDTGGGRL